MKLGIYKHANYILWQSVVYYQRVSITLWLFNIAMERSTHFLVR